MKIWSKVTYSKTVYSRQGYTVHDTQKLITASTYLARLGMMSQSDATKDLTAALKGFKLQAEEAMGVVDELTKLDMNYAASAGQIAEALSRTAAVAQLAGMSMEETAAAVTVIMDVTQQGAEMTGTAMRSMLSRFGQVKAGSFVSIIGDEEDAENINDIEKVLNAIGITIRKNNMEMRAWTDVLADLNEKWITLSDVEKNAIATAMAGTRQRNSFLTLMANYDRFAEAVETAENAQGTAVEKYKAYTDSIEYSVKRLTAAWEEFTQKLSANQALKGFANVTAFLIKHLDSLITHLGTFLMMSNAWRFSGANLKQVFGMGGVATKLSTIMPGQGVKAASGELQVGRGITQLDSDVKTGFSNVLKAMGYDVPDAGGSQNNTGNSKPLKSISKAQLQAKMALVGGATAGLTSAINGAGRFDSLFGVGDVNDTGTDKLVRGVANGVAVGALSAIPGVGPILGATIGPFIGDAIGGGIKRLLHSDELTRKAIIEQAEKEIKAISESSAAIDELVSLTKTDSAYWNAEEWKTWKDSVDKLKELADDVEGGVGFRAAFETLYDGSLDNALNELKDNANGAAVPLMDAAKAAAILAEGEAKYNQGIEDRYQLQNDVSAAAKKQTAAQNYLSHLGESWESYHLAHLTDNKASVQNEQEWNSLYNKWNDELKSATENFEKASKKYNDAILNAQKELDASKMKAAFYSAGVGSKTALEIRNASLEAVVYQIAQQWKEMGYGGAFLGGHISSVAMKEIEQMLREQGGYESLFSNSTRSYGQIKGRAAMLTASGVSYDVLRQAALSEDTNALAQYNNAGIALEEFRTLVLSSDPAKLQQIANGFGMTQDSLEGLGSAVDYLTEADATNNLEKFSEKLKELGAIFVDLTGGKLTQANIDKIRKELPAMLMGESGVDLEGVSGRILEFMTSGSIASLIGGKAAKEALTDQDTFAAWKSGLSQEEQYTLRAYSSMQQMMDAGAEGLDDWLQKYGDYVGDTTVAYELFESYQEQAIKLSQHYLQQEIDGLQSIKDSMGDINRMREKEIALMKARDALENAKNEKKRVYREGLGFVYTADSQAIADAQQNLEKLETEQRQEDVQYQIDTLKNQQDILKNIEENKQLQALEDTFKEALGSDGTFGEMLGYLESLKPETQNETIKKAIVDASKEELKMVQEEEEKAKWEKVGDYKTAYENAVKAYNNASPSEKKSAYNTMMQAKSTWENSYAGLKNTQFYKDNESTYASYTESDANPGQWSVGKYRLGSFPDEGGIISNIHGTTHALISGGYGGALSDKQKDAILKGKYKYYYNPQNKQWEVWDGSTSSLSDGTIVYNGSAGVDQIAMWTGGQFHTLEVWKDNGTTLDTLTEMDASHTFNTFENDGGAGWYYANGSYSTTGGKAFINEFGTEGIVTPYGTLTALPAKSGVVPADLTKNLFELGAVAPTLIRRMEQRDILERSGNSSEDNSMSIQNFYAKFETGDGFDFEKLLVQARQYVALSKQNRVNVK